MVTRLVKLSGFNNLLAGRDLASILKEGHVYSVKEYMGQIILTDIGEHAKMPEYRKQGFEAIMLDGTYCLTKEEKSSDEE